MSAASSWRFRPVLTACAVLGVLVLLGLGTWQVYRLQWKQALIERTERLAASEPAPLIGGGPHEPYAPVWATGGFVTDRVLHVSGSWGGRPGYYVFQPFRPDLGRRLVLVNRGFVPAAQRARTYPLPDAERLTGLYREFERGSTFAAPPDPDGMTAYDRTGETLTRPFRDLVGGMTPAQEGFAPYYLDSTLATELPRGGTTRLDFSNRHLGYAITWYGLAAGLVAIFLLMSRKPRGPS